MWQVEIAIMETAYRLLLTAHRLLFLEEVS
jgi:hypothetical protein